MEKIYLSLGSNLGSRTENINTAVKMLQDSGIVPVQLSSVYETEPRLVEGQPPFYNICIQVKTGMTAHRLLGRAKEIEMKMGRSDTGRYGPRIIDIDILFYNNIIIHETELTIPHPEIANRKFVLQPLKEIAGDFIHPELNVTVSALLDKCTDSGKVSKIGAAGG